MHLPKVSKLLSVIGLVSMFNLISVTPGFLLAEEQPRQGLPGRRQGGGTRGGCSQDSKPLTVLIPETNLWRTTAAYPKFYFYIPQSMDSQDVEFVLRDENDQQVYEKVFTINGDARIISLSLPDSESSSPLELKKNYHWYLSLICNPENRSQDIVVEGWIQRVELTSSIASQLENITPTDSIEIYLEADLWHEALTTLAQLRQDLPNDTIVATNWMQLLQSIGLEEMAQEPLVDVSEVK